MTMNAIDWHASQCACGHITLRLGTIRMEFTKSSSPTSTSWSVRR